MSRRTTLEEHLRQIPIFAGCTKKELQLITRLMAPTEIPAGTVLMKEGELGQEFVVIIEGEATVTRKGRRLATLGPGDFVGEVALLDGGPRTATVVADTPMAIEVATTREFSSLLLDAPRIAHKILVAMAARVRAADAKAVL